MQRPAVERFWPVFLSLIILWVTVAILLVVSLGQHGGHFTYALDDPYIHMAMAKNFAQHGVWGITRYEFSSSSSSLLWTFVIAVVFFLFGLHDTVPFVLCVLCASGCIIVLDILLQRARVVSWPRFLTLVLTIFTIPLPALIFTGQEHILHALVTLVFVYYCTQALATGEARETPPGRHTTSSNMLQDVTRLQLPLLCSLAALLSLTRYEGLMLACIAGIAWLWRGRWLVALAIGIATGLPVFLYGLVSQAQGWFFLPNSVLLKGRTPHLSSLDGLRSFLLTAPFGLWDNKPLFCLCLLAVVLFGLRWRGGHQLWEQGQTTLMIFVTATWLHMQFARTKVFFRYEAYLMAFGLWAIAATFFSEYVRLWEALSRTSRAVPRISQKVLISFGCACLLCPLLGRALQGLAVTPRATTNIYNEQFQMASFLNRYYTGVPVAANDIGLINYRSDIRCLDLWGLASREVAASRLRHTYDRDQIGTIAKAKGVRIAIVFDKWFEPNEFGCIAPGHPGGMPKQWVRVTKWHVPHEIFYGADYVSFYAVNHAEANRLRTNLQQFAPLLPAEVQQIWP